MPSGSFAHLHTHTEFSMLDGASRVRDVVAAAADDGQPAIGITDHGNMYGVLDFYRAARDAGITPILGIEAYQAAESRFERPARNRLDGDKLYFHLTLLAETTPGYRNLIKLSSASYLEGYCILPGQEIVTDSGVFAAENVRVGDMVVTHRGRLRRVTETIRRPFNGTLYGIRLNNSYERVTWMTGEHPVLIRNNDGRVDWVRADQIKSGRKNTQEQLSTWQSFVCLPKVRPDRTIEAIDSRRLVSWAHDGRRFVKESMRSVRGATRHYGTLKENIPLDYDFGFFVGLYAAEGAVTASEVEFTLNAGEFDLIEHVRRVVKDLTGKEIRADRRPDRPGYGGVSLRVASVLLGELLKGMCGTGAANKRLPAFTYEAPDSFRRGVMDGVFAGDASVTRNCIRFTQTSKTLAWQVRLLAAEFCNSFTDVKPRWDGNPKHATQYRTNFTQPEFDGHHRKVLFDDDYVYRPVAEVLTRQYEGDVLNFEVDEDHSYISDFALHNCYKPRVDWELLERHHDGVIATSGCLGGIVCQALLKGDEAGALRLAGRFQDIFGPEHFFVELQDHGMGEQKRTNPQLIDIARRLGAPLLATNDSHYTHPQDAVAHDALLCVQTGASIDDPKRFRFESDQHWLKTATEMRQLFAEVPDACDNTLLIAERADVEIEFGNAELPRFPLPEGFETDDDYLRHLAMEGAHQRYGTPVPAVVAQRLAGELDVIVDMGLSAYFLIVWDLIRHARDHGIRVGVRGSAGGCCVAYCLRIVDLDPIRYGLIFERFLNAGRREMPDIDMDFDERYRREMIRYAAERYGQDHVAQVVTFSTIKARAAVRDASRVLGYPYAVGDRIAKAMPPLVMGRDTSLSACLDQVAGHEDGYKMAAELRAIYDSDPDARKVIDVARGLEGLRRQDGIHAAAVVITREPLTEYLPIQRKPEPGGDPADAPVVTQFEMHGVADLGLLKIDFLGLRNLTVIERALDLIEQDTGPRPDIDNVALDDEKTFEMLRAGDSIGVFQLEGGPMRALMRSLAPTCFEDIGALVALYRPGPMAANMHNDFADRKNGRKPVTGPHDEFCEVLADTYGLMIYQEGLMRVAQHFGGYSLQEADNLRKACAKKIRALMAAEREKFVAACDRTGYGAALGETLFDIMEPFADYAFPKAHAFCYGKVAYQTAWLKANHPLEYLAALLTSVKDDKDRTAVYLAECRSRRIPVTVPDINRSASDFTAVYGDRATQAVDGVRATQAGDGVRATQAGDRDGEIVFGMSAVRNVGAGLVGQIVAERDNAGPFTDFYDFCSRVDPMVLNKRSVESLIKAGAFDSLGHPRLALLEVHERIIDGTLARRREQEQGIMSLFGDLTGSGAPVHDERVPIGDHEFDGTRKLAFEKEMLGLYVSSHPLLGVIGALRRLAESTIAELREQRDGECKWVGGVVTGLARKFTKRGDLMAVFTLEDLDNAIEVMVFPRTMVEYGALLADDAVVLVKGRLDLKEDPAKIVCLEVNRPDLSDGDDPPLRINLVPGSLTDTVVGRLKAVLLEHPGDTPVFLHMERTILRLPDHFRVDSRNGLFAELRVLLGPNGLVV